MVARFKSGMEAAGVRCDTVFYEKQGHGFFNAKPWKTTTLIATLFGGGVVQFAHAIRLQ